jgi:hypothetical protein
MMQKKKTTTEAAEAAKTAEATETTMATTMVTTTTLFYPIPPHSLSIQHLSSSQIFLFLSGTKPGERVKTWTRRGTQYQAQLQYRYYRVS